MKFTTIALLALPFCVAIEPPKQFLRKLEVESDLKSQVRSLVEHHDLERRMQTCVCATQVTTAPSNATESAKNPPAPAPAPATGPLQGLIGGITNLLGGTGFNDLYTALAPIIGALIGATDSNMNGTFDVNELIAALIPFIASLTSILTGLGAIDANGDPIVITNSSSVVVSAANDTVVTQDTPQAVMATHDLLVSIVNSVRDLLTNLTNTLAGIQNVTINTIADAIITVFGVIEGIILSILQIIVNFLGGPSDFQVDSAKDDLMTRFAKLGSTLSGTMGSLESEQPGIRKVFSDFGRNVTKVEGKLETFLNAASASMTNSTVGTDVAVSADIAQIIDLIVGIITSIINLIVNIITTVLGLIIGLIQTAIGIIISIINSIIGVIVSILQAILGIFSADSLGSADNIQSMITSLQSTPSLTELATCTLNDTSCTLTPDEVSCMVDAYKCQSAIMNELMG
jgi:hypothetical protein